MSLKPITSKYAWYINPGALVRNNEPKWKGKGIYCIGPTAFQFKDPEWTALAPVVTELPCLACMEAGIMQDAKGDYCSDCTTRKYALHAEAHRIELHYQFKFYNLKRRIDSIPFKG